MKDALGHGSDAGAHSLGITNLPKKLNRAHFELIAEHLRNTKASPEQVAAAAAHLAMTNPGFNAARFTAAVNGDSKGQGLKSRASSRSNAAKTAANVIKKLTPVQSENAPFKSRLGKSAGHSYLDPHDLRAK